MSMNPIIKLFVVSKRQLGMAVFLVLSLTCLYSCNTDSSQMMNQGGSSTYKKIRYGVHQIPTSVSSWPTDDTQITVSTGNFWDRLRGSFRLQHPRNPKVEAQIRWYIRHQAYLNRSVKRAAPYMYYIFEQVQKRNLPGELVLLPFIESAFNPFAYSGPGAAGIWQIMPQTGTGYGLKRNWWYDGRRDIHASTNAALDYLTYLQSFFDGDWLLAIAAYNTGEGNVQHAIRRNARMGYSTDFFSLGVAQETQGYVPQLLALAAIISNPEEYSIKLPPVRDEPYLAEVNIGYQIDLNEAAQLAGISGEEIQRLNPAYMHKLTGPRSPCCLLLPIDHVETFKQNLAKLSVANHTSLQRYKVRRHETVESIAARFQISSYKLRRINHLKTNGLRPGRTIFVPVESPRITGKLPENNALKDAPETTEESSPKVEKDEKEKINASEDLQESIAHEAEVSSSSVVVSRQLRKISHRVKRGETLQQIAARYHVKLQDLRRWNHIGRRTRLKPGRMVVVMQRVSSNEEVTVSSTKQSAYHHGSIHATHITHTAIKQQTSKSKNPHVVRVSYKVRSGESLPHMAKKCHVSVTDIRRWNHISRTSPRTGQVLTIYMRS